MSKKKEIGKTITVKIEGIYYEAECIHCLHINQVIETKDIDEWIYNTCLHYDGLRNGEIKFSD